jgi:DNA-binding winged helix-turn-helix (wHTH) protein
VRLRFGEWLYDSGSRELRRGGPAVRLSPKAFELLGALLAARPQVLAKAELHDRLWPKTFVSEATLAGLIKELRAALEDDARAPRFVRTAHGYGYAFCGEAVDATRPPAPDRQDRCYRLIWGDREIALSVGENVLGRTQDAVAWIASSSVSRRHARILVDTDGATLEDLGSKNGTRLRGVKIDGPSRLANGDEIRLGSVRMTFHVFDADSTRSDGAD